MFNSLFSILYSLKILVSDIIHLLIFSTNFLKFILCVSKLGTSKIYIKLDKYFILSEVPFSVIDTAFFAEPISDKLNLKWAYYKFLTYDINRMDSGSAIPSTDRYEIYAIEVDLPDVSTQQRVVAVLDSIDQKIKANNKINDNLAA